MKTIAFLYLAVAFCLVLPFIPAIFPPNSTNKTTVVTKILSSSIDQPEVEVILAGDVMLGRTVEQKSKELGDYSYPFRKVGEYLRQADIVFVNLENPIIQDCPPHREGFVLCASPRMLEGLSFSGIDIVNLANNHIGNYGQKGIQETQQLLTQKKIASTGLGELVILGREGTRFGFLGFDQTVRNLNEKDLVLIRESKAKVDILIVGVHWGVEYTGVPTDTQRSWAKQMVLQGADVIAGHHPHWVQTLEIIDGKPVYYSLGNLVFDQMWSGETRKGEIVRLDFRGGELISLERLSIYMPLWAQPVLVE